ncbi:MAG: protealysin inhibitor emfourin [Acidobacteriota bacterium]
MRITFEMDGGFAYIPALNGPFNIDTSTLDPQQAEQVESLVRKARLFDQSFDRAPGAPSGADRRTYTITVDDGRGSRVVKVSDPIGDPALGALIERLQTLGRSTSK